MKHPIIMDYESKLKKDQKANYQDALIEVCESHLKNNERPKLLIHACCAVCSTVALEVLNKYMDIVVYFYNPNIHPREEFQKRLDTQLDLINKFNKDKNANVEFIAGEYKPRDFFEETKGFEEEPEGKGLRCGICYGMRMEDAANKAIEIDSDYFATTLTLSPMKNSETINNLGFDLEKSYDVYYLPSDFKKNGGTQLSRDLSIKYDIYRQNYCGCVFAAKEQKIDFKEIMK